MLAIRSFSVYFVALDHLPYLRRLMFAELVLVLNERHLVGIDMLGAAMACMSFEGFDMRFLYGN
jgi:hypothetical protein